nr:helix-turn-helix transcriptional regulator [Adlercreutzia mucosicola]
MYWRSKTNDAVLRTGGEIGTAGDEHAFESAESAEEHPWAAALGLSPREEEIAALLLKRTPYRQISESLFISENTTKTHVRNIYKKADVSSREELLGVLASLAKKG